jgi:hypothetical protein
MRTAEFREVKSEIDAESRGNAEQSEIQEYGETFFRRARAGEKTYSRWNQ